MSGRRGQSTIEQALVFLAIGAALLVFFQFIRTSVASRFKGGADAFGHGLLYDPKRTYPAQSK